MFTRLYDSFRWKIYQWNIVPDSCECKNATLQMKLYGMHQIVCISKVLEKDASDRLQEIVHGNLTRKKKYIVYKKG